MRKKLKRISYHLNAVNSNRIRNYLKHGDDLSAVEGDYKILGSYCRRKRGDCKAKFGIYSDKESHKIPISYALVNVDCWLSPK